MLKPSLAGMNAHSTDDRNQIKGLVNPLGGLITTLQRADAADRAEVYAELGLRLVYQPSRRVKAVASPMASCAIWIVSEGGLERVPQLLLRGSFSVAA